MGSPIPTPNQLPNVFNKLQQLHIDVRHRLSGRLAASFSYLYEPLSIYDFAFDPSVVNSIVQPSSLVLGYVYRPYTAHRRCSGCATSGNSSEVTLMTLRTKTILPLGALTLALAMPVVAAAQDEAPVKKGQEVTPRRSARPATRSLARAGSRARSTA